MGLKVLYNIYLVCIALPIFLVLTILTAVITIAGSFLGGAHFWGYYPGKIWSILTCLIFLLPVKVEGYIYIISLLADITPTAATITQQCQIYNKDSVYSNTIYVLTTFVCVLTMPLLLKIFIG